MLYEVASPLFTLAGLVVLSGITYSAKCFFDNRLAELDQDDSKASTMEA